MMKYYELYFRKRNRLIGGAGVFLFILFIFPLQILAQKQAILMKNTHTLSIGKTIPSSHTQISPLNSPTIAPQDDEACNQITSTPSSGIENGLGNLHDLEFANDLVIPENKNYVLQGIDFRILSEPGEDIGEFKIAFYEDSGNGPGNELNVISGVTPTSEENLGQEFDFDYTEISIEFDEPVELGGSSEETIYWVGILLENYGGSSSYLEVTSELNTPNMTYYYEEDAGEWVSSLDDPTFMEAYDGVVSFFGECEELETCSGQPDAGEITAGESLEICSDSSFSLTVTGSSQAAGLSYQWQQKSPDEENWTAIEEATNSSLQLDDGINEDTDYRRQITCSDSNESAYTESISVTLKPLSECFCIPSYTVGCSLDDTLNAVYLAGESETLDNQTDCSPNSYGDYTDLTAPDLIPGETYTLTAASSYFFPSSEDLRAWIDFNGNGTFEENEEIANTNGNGLESSGSDFDFQVPEDTEAGNYTMRVRLVYSGGSSIDPCSEEAYGETEDYTVTIIQLEDCEGPVSAGDPTETELNLCANIPFTLEVTGVSDPAEGLTRQWQSSPAGEEDWSDIEGAQSNTYVVNDGIEEPMDFRYVVTCSFGEEEDISDTISTLINAPEECYCTPGATNPSYYINNFSTQNAGENISNMDSGFSDGGYGDFTDQTVSQVPGGEVDFEADLEIGTFGFRIWVDWNKDGQFDEDEVAYQSSSYSDSQSGSFTVPDDAVVGETRMRIVNHWLDSSGNIDPCSTSHTYGEFEDYTFNVVALEECTGEVTAGDPVDTEIDICAEIPFSISVEDPTGLAEGLIRQWQSKPANADDDAWEDLEGAISPNYYVNEGILEETDYRYYVQCNEDTPDYSETIHVSLKPGYECYCTPSGSSNNSDEIINFSLDDFSNDSAPSEGTNGYSDYTDLGPIQLIPGIEYSASLTSGSGSGNHGAAIWIDYNDDGIFSEDEKVAYIDNSIGANETVDFPEFIASSQVGEHRLRVQYTYYQDGIDLDPCNITTSYSETEDYTVLIVDVNCFPPTHIAFQFITDNSAQVIWDGDDDTNNSWLVTYGEEGFDPETEGITLDIQGDPVADLIDLDSETTYDVYVISVCDDDESPLIGPKTFTTYGESPENTRLCNAYELTPNSGCIGGPYEIEGAFEEAYEPTGSCFNDFHGTNSVWFTFVAPANGEATITTDFNSTNFNTELSAYGAPADCTDASTLGEEVGCATTGSDLELTELTPGEVYYVRVAGFNHEVGQFCIEVQLDESQPTSCETPSAITFGDIDDTSAQVSWTANGGETHWEVAYGEVGFSMEDAIAILDVASTQVILSELQPETTYEVYIRAVCSSNFKSDWAGPESFITDQMDVDQEVFNNFSFYPNPVENLLAIEAQTPIENVIVFNLLGQKIIEIQPENLSTIVNAETWQSGVYLMKVTLNGMEKTFRVIKK